MFLFVIPLWRDPMNGPDGQRRTNYMSVYFSDPNLLLCAIPYSDDYD